MYILAVDTSSKTASAALLKDENVIGEYFSDTGFQHSRTLMPMIESLLRCSEISPEEIELYAVTVGPGSFTGVRIGVAAVKGMAFAGNKPCVEISPLETMAMNVPNFDGIVCPTMDARCNQVYNGLFERNGNENKRLCPDRALKIDELIDELKSYNKKVCFLGDGATLCAGQAEQNQIEYIIPQNNILYPKASSVGLIGLEKYKKGEYVTAETLAPLYLRAPQAERMKNK